MIRDIILTDDGDIDFSNGDFRIGQSDEQHVILLINTVQGSWKQFPLAGVGIILYSASAGQSSALRQAINVQLEADGFTNVEVNLVVGNDDTYNYYVNADLIE